MAILSSAVNASKSYAMKKATASFFIRPKARREAARFLADYASSCYGKIGIHPNRPDTQDRRGTSSEILVDHLKNNQLVLTEVLNEVVLAPLPDGKVQGAPPSVPRLPSSSRKALVSALLERLGWQTKTDTDVQIFDAVKDGFNLSIKADVQTRMGEREFLFLSKPLPKQFMSILEGRSTEIILLSSGDSSGVTIEKTLTGLKIPYSTIPYMFPVSKHPDLDMVKVIFPTLRIDTEKQKPYYLIDFEMDPEMYSLLHTHMGFTIVRY